MTEKEKKALAVGAIVLLIILFLLLLHRKGGISTSSSAPTLPTASIPAANYQPATITVNAQPENATFPITVNNGTTPVIIGSKAAAYPKARSCGCSGGNLDGGLVGTLQTLASIYADKMTVLLNSYYDSEIAFAQRTASAGLTVETEGAQ